MDDREINLRQALEALCEGVKKFCDEPTDPYEWICDPMDAALGVLARTKDCDDAESKKYQEALRLLAWIGVKSK